MKKQRYYRKPRQSFTKVTCFLPASPFSKPLAITQLHLTHYNLSKSLIYGSKPAPITMSPQQRFRRSVHNVINREQSREKKSNWVGEGDEYQDRHRDWSMLLDKAKSNVKVFLCEADLIPRMSERFEENYPRMSPKKFTIKRLGDGSKNKGKGIVDIEKRDRQNRKYFQPWETREEAIDIVNL